MSMNKVRQALLNTKTAVLTASVLAAWYGCKQTKENSGNHYKPFSMQTPEEQAASKEALRRQGCERPAVIDSSTGWSHLTCLQWKSAAPSANKTTEAPSPCKERLPRF